MWRAVGLLVIGALSVAGCGDNSAAGCREIREPEDPLSIQHVIDAGSATFLTDPPTSGPHTAGRAARGLLDQPLAPAAQVRVLESGGVVVQYEAPASEVDVRSLLDANEVLLAIAPGTDLPAPVVATAWTWKLTCDTADLDAISRFAQLRAAEAPGED